MTLQWLGSTIWATIRDLLPTHCTGAADAEIGVILCGLLGLLPLHAATRPEPRAPGGLRHALDDCAIKVVSSARLVRDRHRTLAAPRASLGGPAPSVLAVDVAERVGFARLEHVEAEADDVLVAVGRGRRLSWPKATRQAVLAAIESHDILHLACHNIGDVLGAGGARLLLGGGDEVSADDLLDMEGLHARLRSTHRSGGRHELPPVPRRTRQTTPRPSRADHRAPSPCQRRVRRRSATTPAAAVASGAAAHVGRAPCTAPSSSLLRCP